jgi:thiaminase
LDLAKEHSINSATVKYTDFLLATASGKIDGLKSSGKLATPFEKTKIAAYTLGAMAPCMRLYAFLGKKFKELPDSNESTHPYSKWIHNYSSDGFQVCHVDSRAIPYSLCGSLDTILNLGQIYI